MPCATCVHALEQGAYAVYELAVFHPELLPEIPEVLTPEALGAWLVEAAGRVRAALTNPSSLTRPISESTG